MTAPSPEFVFRDDGDVPWSALDKAAVQSVIDTLEPRVATILAERDQPLQLFRRYNSSQAWSSGRVDLSTGWTWQNRIEGIFCHELGHILDYWRVFMTPRREQLIDLFCQHSPQHQWHSGLDSYTLRISEAFAEHVADHILGHYSQRIYQHTADPAAVEAVLFD